MNKTQYHGIKTKESIIEEEEDEAAAAAAVDAVYRPQTIKIHKKNGKTKKQPQIIAGLDHRPPQLASRPIGEQTRAVRRQALMVILGNVGIVAAGMGLGMPTVTLHELTNVELRVHLTQTQASWFASINTLSSPLGGLLSGLLLDKLGRKMTLYVLNALTLSSWLLLAIASHDNLELYYWQLMSARFLSGIGMGLSSAPVGVYSAEISMPKIRGRLILGSSISIAAGITLMYIIGYFIRDDFRLIALICCAYQALALLCVIPMPESPSWLLSKQRNYEAKRSLNYFRGLDRRVDIIHPQVLAEYRLLQNSLQPNAAAGQPKRRSFVRALRLPEVYKPLLLLMGLFAFQQLCGIFVVIVYAVQIAQEAGVAIDPFICAVLIGVARLITTCPMGWILEQWGRRRAGIISTIGMFVCMLLLAALRYFPQLLTLDWPYLPVIGVIGFIVFSTLGLYTLPFFMLSELFPQSVRGPASGLTVAVGMFFAFLCIKSYPNMKSLMGSANCFIFYAVMSLIAAIYIYLVLPETRRRTLLEIEAQFRCKAAPKEIAMREVCVNLGEHS